MTIEFKENAKFTKLALVESGRRILDFIEQAKDLDKTIDEFQIEPNCLFNIEGRNNNLNLNYNDLLEAIKLIQSKLGEIELQEGVKKKG